MTRSGFPSPFDVQIPPGCEGWEELYACHAVFHEDRRDFDESRFWFQDGLHWAEPYHPFDAVALDSLVVAFNQASARLFVLPPSQGTEYRLLNGYVYLSPNSVTDEATLARRADAFTKRGGYYFEHWNDLYTNWLEKVEQEVQKIESLVVPELPELEDEALVREGRGLGSSHALVLAFDRLLQGLDRVCQYHCEFLNLGYAAYLLFYEVCRQAFPGIADQTIAKLVSGIDVVLLRPDDELRRLARRALELEVADKVKGAVGEGELRAALGESDGGRQWLSDFEKSKHPWFNFSYGNGMYHYHRSWIDDATLPIATIGSYIARLELGDDIIRPYAAVCAERDRITAEYRELLPAETREAFDEQLALARTVFPFIENHNFYIDHWYFTLFWNKVREFGALLAEYGFVADQEDVFYLRHDEVRSALEEVRISWSGGGSAALRGSAHWPRVVERRKSIYDGMRRWAPPPALGRVPEEIAEPVFIMLWGITTERVRAWLASSDGEGRLTGVPGSPGIATGKARVIQRPDQLGELQEGEILVAPATSPSWTPVFGKIAAAVMDTGGIMCHAAIVAREYGLPAIVGTGSATQAIKTGDRLHVDATAGVVTILD